MRAEIFIKAQHGNGGAENRNEDQLKYKGTEGGPYEHIELAPGHTRSAHEDDGRYQVYTTGDGGKTHYQDRKAIESRITRAHQARTADRPST